MNNKVDTLILTLLMTLLLSSLPGCVDNNNSGQIRNVSSKLNETISGTAAITCSSLIASTTQVTDEKNDSLTNTTELVKQDNFVKIVTIIAIVAIVAIVFGQLISVVKLILKAWGMSDDD